MAQNSYKKTFVLRTGYFENERYYEKEFDTYEEAYDRMCSLYAEEKTRICENLKEVPTLWKIFSKTVSTWNGNTNTCIMQA